MQKASAHMKTPCTDSGAEKWLILLMLMQSCEQYDRQC